MKKITLIVISMLLCPLMFAQTSITPFDGTVPSETQKAAPEEVSKGSGRPAANYFSRWYNYGETMQLYHSMPGTVYDDYLFPDTTILGTVGFGLLRTHKIGDVLDVTSPLYNDVNLHPNDLHLGSMASYYLDSVAVHIIYDRFIVDTTIVDTLLIELVVNTNLSTVYFAPNSAVTQNLGTDTVFLKSLPYHYQSNRLNVQNKHVYKVPLTYRDFQNAIPNNGEMVVKIATDDLPQIMPGRLVASSVGFIPGYSWTQHVDNITSKNGVKFLTRKQRPNQFPHYIKHDYNISYTIPTDVRYNLAPGWNGLYIPSFAYMGGATGSFPYEHHMIYYKVRSRFNISASYPKSFPCYGQSNGYINLNVEGGAPPYNFIWNTGDTTQNLQNLQAGTYRVTITDSDDEIAIRSYNIRQPASPIQTTITSTPTSSCGGSDGTINISNTSGGSPPYSVIILDADSINQAPVGLPAGVYTVKINDANACTYTTYVGISETGAATLNAQVNEISCPGMTDASISLSLVNPTGTPTYAWNTGQTTPQLSGLAPGHYIVTITDGNCMIYEVFKISDPDPIIITANIVEPSHGAENGMIILNVNGGTPPYTYLWSSGQTTKNIGSLGPGSYTVTVTDANNCTEDQTFDVGTTAVKDLESHSEIILYPNPVSDKLYLKLKTYNYEKDLPYHIYNLYGQKVAGGTLTPLAGSETYINVSNLSSGYYFIEFYVNNKRLVSKFVK